VVVEDDGAVTGLEEAEDDPVSAGYLDDDDAVSNPPPFCDS
jgi:hypothetical protein